MNGHHKDILTDAAGNVVEVEEEVSFDSLPANVQATLKKRAGGGTITVVESLTKNGRLVITKLKLSAEEGIQKFRLGQMARSSSGRNNG